MRIILMLFGGVAVLIVAGISYILLMSPQQMDEIAIITADERPYKVVPVNPGGAEIKNTDSTFLNSLDSGGQIPEGGEQLLPEDPVPELPPIDVTTDLAEQAVEPETDIVLDDQTIAADEAGDVTDLDKGSDTGTEKDNLETAEKLADDNQPEPEVSDDSKVLTDTENKAGIVPSVWTRTGNRAPRNNRNHY